MNFISRSEARKRFEGKSVALVGSGPGAVKNQPGFVDDHQVVTRVNNYKLLGGAGCRTDVFYSFFGTSVRKTAEELRHDGVKLCLCKCPNALAIDSEWHRANGKMAGVDFRYIYERRASWWFCDTFIPTVPEFLVGFELLGRHIPTTGFSAILEILSFEPRSLYLTGFDFFRSGRHNVNEPWQQKNTDDPIGHVPEVELAWLRANIGRYPITTDLTLRALIEGSAA